jgi:plasmid stability protein
MKKQKVKHLYIRDMPHDLMCAIRMKAAKEGRTRKAVCIEILRNSLLKGVER